MEALSGTKRKADSSSDITGLGIDGAVDFTNQLFSFQRTAQLLQERQALRVKLLKLDNQIESQLRELEGVPAVRAAVNSFEKNWQHILALHQKKIETEAGPKKKKSKPTPEAASSSAPAPVMEE